MKFSSFLLVATLAVAAPLPAPIEERDPLNILGIDLPILNIPGLNLGNGINGAPNPTGPGATGVPESTLVPTATNPSTPIPTDNISKLLTPLLENLGAPHQEVVAVVETVNSILTGTGILPSLDILNLLPSTLSGEQLNVIGTVLKQVLQGVIPGDQTATLVDNIIGTLQNILQVKPSPSAPGISYAPTATATAGVGNGVQSLADNLLNLLTNANPSTASLTTLGSQLKTITSLLNQITSIIKLNPTGPDANALGALLAQVIAALNKYIFAIPAGKQFLLTLPGLPLLNGLGGLIGAATYVPGLNTVLGGLLGKLLGGLSSGSNGTLGNILAKLLNGILGILNQGNKPGAGIGGLLNNLLAGLGLGILG